MHSLFKGFIIVFGLTLATCAPTSSCPQPTKEQAKKSQLALTDFAINLFKNVASKDESKNEIFSPVSIALGLAMLESGADGKTRQEIKKVLLEQYSTNEDVLTVYRALEQQLNIRQDKTNLTIGNVIYYDNDLQVNKDYLNALDCLKTEARQADFKNQLESTRQSINKFIGDQTQKKIQELFKKGDLTKDDRVVLANYVYFKSSWKQSFSKTATKQDTFYKNGREQQNVQFMEESATLRHLSSDDLDALELPYDQQDLAMYVLLPKSRDGVRDLEKKLTGQKLIDIMSQVQSKPVKVQLPKFSVRARIDLKKTLSQMGLETMFNEDADFHRISKELSKVDSGVHEAFLTVDENGTEGAAATGFGVRTRAMPLPVEPETPFKADHPFLYAVVHKQTGAIVFLGKVNSIEQQE